MKKYRVKKKIVLTFLTPQDSYSCIFGVGTIIEANEHTIWLIGNDGSRKESIETITALYVWLENDDVEEIT
jgi:hypothetical protein